MHACFVDLEKAYEWEELWEMLREYCGGGKHCLGPFNLSMSKARAVLGSLQ